MVATHELAALEVITVQGEYNFRSDPAKSRLFVEAERIHAAFHYDPLFAVKSSLIECILAITPGSLAKQSREEELSKFNISFPLVNLVVNKIAKESAKQ